MSSKSLAHGNVEADSLLLEYGANGTNTHSESGVTALMYAAANRKENVVKVLLEKANADIDQRHLGGGKALLKAAFDPNDQDGVSPHVIGVASQSDLEGQKMIVEAWQKAGKWGAELNRTPFSGGTIPPYLAAAGNHTECANHFVELGALIDARSKATLAYLAKLANAMGRLEQHRNKNIMSMMLQPCL
jgi:hypothetical protein